MKKIIMCFVVLIAFPIQAYSTTHVLLTIDVESFSKGNPEKDIWGKLEGHSELYGIPKIIDILDKYNAKATFYLNVYEIAKHGEEPIRKVAQEIVARGQDIQLHTHPKPMYGKAWMSNYTFKDQVKIIKKGKELIKQWTRVDVVSHRAGAYLGNADTLKALTQSQILADSSLSPASNSPLYREGYISNDITSIGNVIEIPVTYFKQISIGHFESLRYLDIESSSFRELKSVIDQMEKQKSCAVNIMMHSFSFTRYGKPDYPVIKKLEDLLSYVNKKQNLKMSSTTELINSYQTNSLECVASPDFIPETGVLITYMRAWERFNYGWKNIVVALSPIAMVFLICGSFLIVRLTRHSSCPAKSESLGFSLK